MLLRVVFFLIPSLCFAANNELVISPKSEENIKVIVKSMTDEVIKHDEDFAKNLEKKLINYINKSDSKNIKILTNSSKNKNYILFFWEKDLMIPKNIIK